jgi:hypothetical protein
LHEDDRLAGGVVDEFEPAVDPDVILRPVPGPVLGSVSPIGRSPTVNCVGSADTLPGALARAGVSGDDAGETLGRAGG